MIKVHATGAVQAQHYQNPALNRTVDAFGVRMGSSCKEGVTIRYGQTVVQLTGGTTSCPFTYQLQAPQEYTTRTLVIGNGTAEWQGPGPNGLGCVGRPDTWCFDYTGEFMIEVSRWPWNFVVIARPNVVPQATQVELVALPTSPETGWQPLNPPFLLQS